MTPLAERLKHLSSAEDFLQFFGVPFDQKVVDVCRLHILKRFFQYIRQQASIPQDTEAALFATYRDQLARAYRTSSRRRPPRKRSSRYSRTSTAASTCPSTLSARRCRRAAPHDGETHHAHRRLHQAGSGFGADPVHPVTNTIMRQGVPAIPIRTTCSRSKRRCA
jgi:hypothetical protein